MYQTNDKEIYLNDIIGKNRTILMGYAIIVVVLYHLSFQCVCDIPYMKGLLSFGWYGVEIFLFLSGWGLYHSFSKNPDMKQYYAKRFLRIMPTYLIVILIYSFIEGYSLFDAFLKWSTFSFWFGKSYFDWYIPSIVILYLILPFLYKWVNKNRNSFVVFCMMIPFPVTYFLINQGIMGNYDLRLFFLARIPVFCLGLLVASKKITLNVYMYKIMPLVCVLVLFLVMLVGRTISNNLSVLRLLMFIFTIPVSLTVVQFLDAISSVCIRSIFNYCGIISLEIYLVHEHLMKDLDIEFDFWDTTLLLIAILLVSKILHLFVGRSLKIINVLK